MPLIATKGAASAQGFGEFAQSAAPVYIEDVMSVYLYDGNGSTQTITNGIDLAGKGGLVWAKSRSRAGDNHEWRDTVRGGDSRIFSNNTNAASATPNPYTYNSNGYTIGGDGGNTNENGITYASWTFRKQPKFFDVVTWTGNNVNGRQISHNLGSTPGCIIVKSSSLDGTDWVVHHRSLGFSQVVYLNSTVAAETTSRITAATSTTFTISDASTLNSGGSTYVAYLFAHDAGGFGLTGLDNVISCGSYTGNGSATGPTVTLGYEPQLVMIKNAGGVGNWNIIDNLRGFCVAAQTSDRFLEANTADAESTATWIDPLPTGFAVTSTSAEVNSSATNYIYIAIRRGPMKTPTSGTEVFQPTVYTGTNVDNRLVDTTIAPDMVWVRQRNDTVLGGMVVGDRLRGQPYLLTGTTAAQVNDADAFDAQIVSTTEYGTAFSAMNGFWCGNDATAKLNASTTTSNQIAEAFKRAPGFFDVVCYTGTGASLTLNHNLGVTPELVISKRRSGVYDWTVYSSARGTANTLFLNLTNAETAYTSVSAATSTTFTVEGVASAGGETFVAYLFASCPGVSKVGSYTGTGTTKQIDCGFTGGARFVLIKRTDSTGDWYVWDSARGIVAGNDPYLLLNSTAAEVTGTDYVDTLNAGFEISSTAPAAINANGGTFIFLAIA